MEVQLDNRHNLEESDLPITTLNSEIFSQPDSENIKIRRQMVNEFLKVPNLKDSLGMLQYLTSQTGCPNICNFCSQGAATDVFRIDRTSLGNIFSALKTVDRNIRDENEKTVIATSSERHKPGVVFLYQDTDVASDPNMGYMVQTLSDDFGLKSRISTVGWSRHNEELQTMHQDIANDHPQAIDGFRVSITPYTDGVAQKGDKLSRSEYEADIANLLNIYTPVINEIGVGKDKFAMEMRFAPLVYTDQEQIRDEVYKGRHLIKSGNTLVLSNKDFVDLKDTNIVAFENRKSTFSDQGVEYIQIQNDKLLDKNEVVKMADLLINSDEEGLVDYGNVKNVRLHRFNNIDGHYYAIDPGPKSTGHFEAFHIYPLTDTRKVSGYNDASRYFLNTLIDYKHSVGLKRRDQYEDASWDDVENIIELLNAKAIDTAKYSEITSKHIWQNIIPIVEMQKNILQKANFNPAYFFNPNFLIDTGQIVNQGRAKNIFKGLVSKADIALTPHEERGYGEFSFSSQRGNVWKISPIPNSPTITAGKIGIRNISIVDSNEESKGTLMFAPLDWANLEPIAQQAHFFDGIHNNRISLKQSQEGYFLPGLIKNGND